ncbi:MAG: diphthine--ammonia ligase [Bacteroidia bacterium]|nr:diphthine--ammonia ligase [Bacteroidia bacterium]
MNWSSGKDSAFALYEVLKDKRYSVDLLLTTVNAGYRQVSMHGLRVELLEIQARATGIPFTFVELPLSCRNEEYEKIMSEKVTLLRNIGFECAVFGDIFLEDLKIYREENLSALGIHCVFPLWKRNTKKLALEFLELGFKAIVVSVNCSKLDLSFAGREYDREFLKDLPPDVDPCGENGEFHTFCYAGPVFEHEIKFKKGEVAVKEYLHEGKAYPYGFCDLIPEENQNKHELKSCPRCAAMFECKVGSVLLCQCSKITLTEDERDFMKKHFTDCLCLSCMKDLRAEFHKDKLNQYINKILNFKK